MANEIVMTKEGYDDLVKELAELKTTRRAEISEKNPHCTRFWRPFRKQRVRRGKERTGNRRGAHSDTGKPAEEC